MQRIQREHLYLGGAALAVTLMTAIGAGTVMADTKASTPSQLAQAIADKFKINATDVQGVIDQQHQVKEQEITQKVSDKLDQAVKDGKMTQAQRDELAEKLEALRPDLSKNFRDMTADERKAAMDEMQTKRQELKTWLDEQGLNELDIHGLTGPGGKRMGMGFGPGSAL